MVQLTLLLGKIRTVGAARRLRTLAVPCCMVGISALVACAHPADELTLHQTEQPILRGTLDREHPEVMLLAHRAGFLCTGTVIDVEERSGHLLTAAHCVTEEDEDGNLVALDADDFLVVPGADFAESTTAYSVQAVRVAPGYDGLFALDDVAVVRFFFGSEPAPAAIPPLGASEDQLGVGSALVLVGYGQTEIDDANTQRRRVARSIVDLDDELIAYSQEDGKGACFGDSGGPAVVQVSGQARVAAVISGAVTDATGSCAGGTGVAMRVSAYEGFIEGALSEGRDDG
jgi:secreted trypsin-like serine protease